MKEKIINFIQLYSKQIVLIMFVLLSLLVVTAYFVDKKSINEANESETRQVPNADDPSTWALFPWSPSSEENEAPDKLSFVSSTTTYPLNYENLASGKIAISGINLNEDYYNDNQTGFGYLLFNKGLSYNCVPYPNDTIYNCDGFKEGVIRLLDVVSIPVNKNWPDYLTEYPNGLIIFEYSTSSTKKIFLASLVNTYNKNIVIFDRFKVLDLPLGQDYSLVYEEGKNVLSDFGYHNVKVVGGGLEKSFTLETISLRGYVGRISEREGNKIINKFINYKGYFDNEAGYTKYTKEGVLTISHSPDKFWLHEFYARTQLFSPWNTTIKEDMYHKNDCGLPYSFSDMALNIRSGEDFHASLEVSIPNNKSYYNLTTAMYGYEPEEWGTIIDTVNVQAYREAIKKGLPFNGYRTELLTIAGVPVRHTLPFDSSRPCDGSVYESYQWVKEGNIYTLELVTEKETETAPVEQSFIRSVLEEIINGASYVPSETIQ